MTLHTLWYVKRPVLKADANRLNKLIRKAAPVLGVELQLAVREEDAEKTLGIMNNFSHPLHATHAHYCNYYWHLLHPHYNKLIIWHENVLWD